MEKGFRGFELPERRVGGESEAPEGVPERRTEVDWRAKLAADYEIPEKPIAAAKEGYSSPPKKPAQGYDFGVTEHAL